MVVVNRTYELAPWADVLYSGDARFWSSYQPNFAGMKVCGDCDCEDKGRHFADARAWLPDTCEMHISGAQALVYTAAWGANPIILTGFDMWGGHWHADHNAPLIPESSFAQRIVGFRKLKADLDALGVCVINATPGSALGCFEGMDLHDALTA